MSIKHCLKRWLSNSVCPESWKSVEQKLDVATFTIWPSLTQLGHFLCGAFPRPPKRATWLKPCLPLFAFLPTPWETHSRRELPSESLNEKAPAFWPFSSGTPCLHFQGSACHFGPLPLAPVPHQGSLKLYKIM